LLECTRYLTMVSLHLPLGNGLIAQS